MIKKTSNIFTILSLLFVLILTLTACGEGQKTESPTDEPVVEEPATEKPDTEEQAEDVDTGAAIEFDEATHTPAVVEDAVFGEASMLAEMVAAGELPAVEERLPMEEDIFVVTPVDGIGEYGGTWHNVTWGEDMGNIELILYDPPVRWKADYSGYEPGVLRSWEISEDGKSLTWNFRRGIKWSDGVDFIPAVDLAYWWELATNEEFVVVFVPYWGFNSDGTRMEVSFPDDYTMVFNWTEPHYITNFFVAQGYWEWLEMERPKHFLSPHDPNYDSSKTYEDLEAVVFGTNWLVNVEGYPCLHAWCPSKVIPGERSILTRNPYYWKIDTAGNQLPYIDYLDTEIIGDEEVRLLEISQGKYEASFRGTDNPTSMPFLLDQAEAHDYYLHPGAVNGAGGWPVWLINMNFNDCETYPDTCEEIRALLQNQDFRIGLAHALDRERLIDVVWDGIGYPTNATISPQSWHFTSEEGRKVYEAWRDAYVAYDPDLTAQHFEAAGFIDVDEDGYRDLPSGAAFTLVIDQINASSIEIDTESNESFASDLEAVGVKVLIDNLIGQPDSWLRQWQSLYMLRNGHAAEMDIWTYPDWIFPVFGSRSWPLEGEYYRTGGEEVEDDWKPQPGTTYAYELQELYTKGLATADIDERHKIVWEAIQIHIDHGPFMIGGSGDQQQPAVIRNGFHGIPDLLILGPWAPGTPGNLYPEQFWMEASLRGE